MFIKLKHNAHLVVFIQLLYYFKHIPKEPYANLYLHRLFSGIFRCLASLILVPANSPHIQSQQPLPSLAGGLNAIQAAMIVGAIPFSFMMILMGISLLKALYRDGLREQSLAQKETL
ncbi:MAG: BCCT family transporter [Oceanospirillaceae bacterium]